MVLILGDSTGVGVGATRPEESVAGLFAADYPEADIVNVAASGARVTDAITQVRRCSEAGLCFDLALLHVGGVDVVADTPLRRLADDCDILMRELGRIAARIAWLELLLPAGADASVELDGRELDASGSRRAVPVDPDGFVYSLGPWSGDVGLGDGSTLAPLPKEPSAGSAVPAAGS